MAVTTWAQALADTRVTLHWLLVLSSPNGVVGRFADADLEVSGVAYSGALEVDSAPTITADPYSSSMSSQAARVTILPLPSESGASSPTRPYDLEELYSSGFLQMGAKLYRWAEGTAFSEADLVIDGYVDGATLDTDGELALEIVDMTAKYNRAFPRYFIGDDRLPEPYADDKNMGYPLLYGTFTRVPCGVIDVSNNRAMLAEGAASTLTQAYLDDSSVGTEALVTGLTDSMGVSYCRVSVGSAIGDAEVTADGTGYADDAEGYYSGTASALLTHPADQLHHLARTYAEIPSDKVDAASFYALRGETSGYVGAIQVQADEKTNFFNVCSDACRYLRAVIGFERGKLTARRLDFNRSPVMSFIDEVNLVSVESIGWGDKGDLLSRVTLRYNWGWRKKRKTLDFKATAEIDSDNYAPFAANLSFVGVSELDLESRMISDSTTAESAIAAIAELYSKVRKQVKLRVTREAHTLRIYDVVTLTTRMAPSSTGAGWSNKKFIVVGINCGLDEDTLSLLEV